MSFIILGTLMALTSAFLILIVLLQKGKGGGLTGALGGAGGESAFGSKAGDTFTRVTMATAVFWILLCMFSIRVLSSVDTAPDAKAASMGGGATGIGAPADGEDADDEASEDAATTDADDAATADDADAGS